MCYITTTTSSKLSRLCSRTELWLEPQPRGKSRALPVSQSQSRQLLSAEPVSTCRVSPRSLVREYHQRILSPKKLPPKLQEHIYMHD